MLLENKNAVIYGAGGDVGSAVARAFAREGASLLLCDACRQYSTVPYALARPEELASLQREIEQLGCSVIAEQVDVTGGRRGVGRGHVQDLRLDPAPAGALGQHRRVTGVGIGAEDPRQQDADPQP